MDGPNHDRYGIRDGHNLNDKRESLIADHAIFWYNLTKYIWKTKHQLITVDQLKEDKLSWMISDEE